MAINEVATGDSPEDESPAICPDEWQSGRNGKTPCPPKVGSRAHSQKMSPDLHTCTISACIFSFSLLLARSVSLSRKTERARVRASKQEREYLEFVELSVMYYQKIVTVDIFLCL